MPLSLYVNSNLSTQGMFIYTKATATIEELMPNYLYDEIAGKVCLGNVVE